MDTRRSYYLASRQDDFDSPAPDEDWVDFSDIPYVVSANDNTRIKRPFVSPLRRFASSFDCFALPQMTTQ